MGRNPAHRNGIQLHGSPSCLPARIGLHAVPFTVLQVQFDAAPGVTLLTNLADECDAPSIRVGSRVVIEFTEVS